MIPLARHPNRRTLFLIFALTLLPFVLAQLTYHYYRPSHLQSYGQLLSTQALENVPLIDPQGQTLELHALRGKWLLLMIDNASCPNSCLQTLFTLRQLRLAQGENMQRVQRVWFVNDTAKLSAAALERTDGTQIYRLQGPLNLPGTFADSIYLIDTLGNQVMRYPRTANPQAIIKELANILKNNLALG